MDYNTHGSQGGTTTFCLGHPSHALLPGETICHICGALAGGSLLGAYQVQCTLGMGRSGYAYIAVHQRSGQPVTLKLFPPDNTTTPLWEAARREVRVATALRHPSILAIYSSTSWNPVTSSMGASGVSRTQADTQQNYLLTLCQFIPGNLNHFISYYQQADKQRELIENGSSLQQLLMKLIQQTGSALSTAHQRGIAHGAITPGNMLFNEQERAWIADFGLAKLHPPAAPYLPPELYSASQASLQMSNIGAYWQAANPTSDQYMFAMLCQQLFAQLLPQREYEKFQSVLQRATHHKPERRYPSLELLVADLLTLAQHPSSMRNLATRPGNTSAGSNAIHPQLPYSPTQPGLPPGPPISIIGLRGGHNAGPATPPPAINGGPLTPALPATPFTPVQAIVTEDWEKRGDKLFTQREYEGALQAYHRALEVDWNKENVWVALGDTYFALERYRESLMAYEQAMNLNPNDPQTWTNRGTALDALGRHREAVDCYERADQLRTA